MTNADQITHALQHIAAHGGDLPLETDLALKALASDYERQREEVATRHSISENNEQKLMQEIERLKRIVEEVKSINAEYVDAISTSKTAMSRIGGLFEND